MLSFYFTIIDNEDEKCKFEQIYLLYKKRMWYIANQVLNDPIEAEDAVHNAFIGIAKNMHHINEVDSRLTFSYVITAAKNAAINISTREHKNKPVNIEDYKNIPDEKSLQKLYTIENKSVIKSALKKLPDQYRDLLCFHYCYDMSEKEIAAQTGLKYATVRKQISRAKHMLADLIVKEDETFAKR